MEMTCKIRSLTITISCRLLVVFCTDAERQDIATEYLCSRQYWLFYRNTLGVSTGHYPTVALNYNYVRTYLQGYMDFIYIYIYIMPIPVAARSKAWACGRFRAGIVGSNLAGDRDVCLL
jgi:hypothetical protein